LNKSKYIQKTSARNWQGELESCTLPKCSSPWKPILFEDLKPQFTAVGDPSWGLPRKK